MNSVSAVLFCAAAACGQLNEEFYQDFRSPKFPPSTVLSLSESEGDQKVLKREREGVQITLSGKPSGFPPFGVSPRFRVCGDFEITASYEVLKLDRPTSGYGVSVSLWVMSDTSPEGTAATLSRSHRPWDGNVFVADKGWWSESEKKYHHDQGAFPTTSRAGRLRLVRTGSTLHYLVADGDSEEFRELRQVKFNKEDLVQVYLGVDTGDSQSPAEVRLRDLRIRAEELPFGARKKQTVGAWLAWSVAGIAGGAAVVAGCFFLRRSARGKSPGTPAAAPGGARRRPGVNPGVVN